MGDFETGFDANNGQTREHAMIAKSLGVQQIIVAVNKMDCNEWNRERFEYIVCLLTDFLKEIGFANGKNKKKQSVIFIPVSGLTGGNLIGNGSEDMSDKWWKNQDDKDLYRTNLSLFEVIDSLRPNSTILSDSLDGKLRMSITDIYKELNVGIVATGKILSGAIMNHDQIIENEEEIIMDKEIKYIKESKPAPIKKRKRKKTKHGIVRRQFIGNRIESEQNFQKHKLQKRELIKDRFGILDESELHTSPNPNRKKKKKKKNELKPHINLVVIGHVDAGKSTLMGRLLYEYGTINSKQMHK